MTIQHFPDKTARRAVKQVTINVDPHSLTGADWELLNGVIKVLFSVGPVEVAVARSTQPGRRRTSAIARDWKGAAAKVNGLRRRQASAVVAEHVGTSAHNVHTNYWQKVTPYLRRDDKWRWWYRDDEAGEQLVKLNS